MGTVSHWDHINAQATETSHWKFGKSCKKPMNIITYNNMILVGFLQIGDDRTCTNIMKHNEFDVWLAFHITIIIPKIWCNDSDIIMYCVPTMYSFSTPQLTLLYNRRLPTTCCSVFCFVNCIPKYFMLVRICITKFFYPKL